MDGELVLRPAARKLRHQFYQGFENAPAAFPDMGRFKPYVYDGEKKVGFHQAGGGGAFPRCRCGRPAYA